MKKSYYFEELASAYDAEIQDLLSDSEGKSALKARLQEKRRELQGILAMIDFAPEMVVPVFYDAFSFPNTKAMHAAINCEPDDDDFPTWDRLSGLVKLADWAQPHAAAVLGEATGEAFMVTAACLEFIRKFDNTAPVAADEENEENEDKPRGEGDEDEDDDRDLADAGDDWLGTQGFDSRHS